MRQYWVDRWNYIFVDIQTAWKRQQTKFEFVLLGNGFYSIFFFRRTPVGWGELMRFCGNCLFSNFIFFGQLRSHIVDGISMRYAWPAAYCIFCLSFCAIHSLVFRFSDVWRSEAINATWNFRSRVSRVSRVQAQPKATQLSKVKKQFSIHTYRRTGNRANDVNSKDPRIPRIRGILILFSFFRLQWLSLNKTIEMGFVDL